jgi:hypothetical protein
MPMKNELSNNDRVEKQQYCLLHQCGHISGFSPESSVIMFEPGRSSGLLSFKHLPVKTQWHEDSNVERGRFIPLIKLTATGIAPVLHRTSLLMAHAPTKFAVKVSKLLSNY